MSDLTQMTIEDLKNEVIHLRTERIYNCIVGVKLKNLLFDRTCETIDTKEYSENDLRKFLIKCFEEGAFNYQTNDSKFHTNNFQLLSSIKFPVSFLLEQFKDQRKQQYRGIDSFQFISHNIDYDNATINELFQLFKFQIVPIDKIIKSKPFQNHIENVLNDDVITHQRKSSKKTKI